jgi:phosphomannomutase/phosphoglucomutase
MNFTRSESSMPLPKHIFREYDVRGIAGRDLTEQTVELLGRALAVYLKGKKKHNRMAIGRDGRLTSRAFSHALVDGLTASGVDVIDLGEVPTGVTYFSLFSQDVDGGVQITGSHNPKEYNGLKIAVGDSTIHGKEIQKLREIAEKGEFPAAKKPVTITRMDIVPKYHAEIRRRVKLKRKLKVVVDAGNGVGGKVAVPLFEAMGCEVIPLYCDVDGNFPNHHPDPTLPSTLKDLIALVKRKKADLGIAFDGDADRIGAVDEKGNIIAGDMLLLLFARSVLADKPGATIIGEVKCSRVLYEDVAAHGGKPIMWMAGHSLIKDAMKRFNGLMAGEMSGHMFFKHDWYGFDCAVYAGARLLEIVARHKKPLSAHLAGLPKMYATEEIRIETSDAKKFKIVEHATKFFQDQGFDVKTIDGARIEFADGWGLLRVSNTSPMLVMRAEASSPTRLKEIKALIEKKVGELNR